MYLYKYTCGLKEIFLSSLRNINGGPRYSGLSAQIPPPASVKNCIQLAACGSNELLPMNPELPADLFSSCLTTPIKVALRWFVLQNTGRLVPSVNLELIDK